MSTKTPKGPQMSTQPTEAQYALACRIWCCKNSGDGAQLIADSEAQAVEKAFPDSGDDSLCNVRRLRTELTAEREKVRVLREALKTVARFPMERHQDLAKAALAATEGAK